MSRVERVFIDTNELFPFTVMDVLLTLSEDRLFDWMWTDEVLDEWERVIVREKKRTASSAQSVTAAVRHGFASTRLDPATYRHLITDDLSPDAADRAHVAACISGSVDVVLTRNAKDFPIDRLALGDVRVRTSDDYLVELLVHRPRAVQESVTRLAASRTQPSMTRCELVARIDKAGAHAFAARLGHRFNCGTFGS